MRKPILAAIVAAFAFASPAIAQQKIKIGFSRYERINHLGIQQCRVEVQEVTDASRHTGRNIAARLSEYDGDATGHVFTAVIPQALDDGNRTRVANAEPLANLAADEELA